MIFTIITKDLQKELKSNLPQIMVLLKKQPGIAYKKIGDIGKEAVSYTHLTLPTILLV